MPVRSGTRAGTRAALRPVQGGPLPAGDEREHRPAAGGGVKRDGEQRVRPGLGHAAPLAGVVGNWRTRSSAGHSGHVAALVRAVGGAELFDEHRDPGAVALAHERGGPGGVHAAGAGSGLAADDDPVDAVPLPVAATARVDV
jgi:hypothetical protein